MEIYLSMLKRWVNAVENFFCEEEIFQVLLQGNSNCGKELF